MPSTVHLGIENGYATVRLYGDLDLATQPLLDSFATWRPPLTRHAGLLVDLTSVTFIDAASTRWLATILDTADAKPSLVLCQPGVVASSLDASGFSRRYDVVSAGLPQGRRLREAEVRLLMRPMSTAPPV